MCRAPRQPGSLLPLTRSEPQLAGIARAPSTAGRTVAEERSGYAVLCEATTTKSNFALNPRMGEKLTQIMFQI